MTDDIHRAYITYTTQQTVAAQFAVFGAVLLVVGFAWGMTGLDPAIQETTEGITIVEGGAERGALLGPAVSAFGTLGLVIARTVWQRSRQTRRAWVAYRDGDAA